jgi:hypothetical protein
VGRSKSEEVLVQVGPRRAPIINDRLVGICVHIRADHGRDNGLALTRSVAVMYGEEHGRSGGDGGDRIGVSFGGLEKAPGFPLIRRLAVLQRPRWPSPTCRSWFPPMAAAVAKNIGRPASGPLRRMKAALGR